MSHKEKVFSMEGQHCIYISNVYFLLTCILEAHEYALRTLRQFTFSGNVEKYWDAMAIVCWLTSNSNGPQDSLNLALIIDYSHTTPKCILISKNVIKLVEIRSVFWPLFLIKGNKWFPFTLGLLLKGQMGFRRWEKCPMST